jgi:addiction module RelE/StbE family toxin
MWKIQEHRRVAKQLHGRTPAEVLKRYQKWKEIVRLYGPDALRDIAGFHDKQLHGQWAGHRSCRLGLKWRVIYRVLDELLLIQVVEVNAHDY